MLSRHQPRHQSWSSNVYADNNRPSPRILNRNDTDTLLSGFPITRLSYEVSIHKNDTQYASARNERQYKYFILPKGKRCVAWATEWKRNRIFVIIDIQRPNNRRDHQYGGNNRTLIDIERPFIRKFYQENGWYPGKVSIYDACFDRELVYGTVFGGILFRNENIETPLFSIHTIYWYKGEPIPSLSGLRHIELCEEIFYNNNIRQISYTKDNSVIFGLPVLCDTEQDAYRIASQLPYQTFSIQYRSIQTTQIYQILIRENDTGTVDGTGTGTGTGTEVEYTRDNITNNTTMRNIHTNSSPLIPVIPSVMPMATTKMKPLKQAYIPSVDDMLTNIQAIFIVRPNLQNDIYELFVMSDVVRQREPIFYNFALIPNFKTSVYMNRLFRNIIENECLDTMEESEDETDFENTEPDKYVTLSKEYLMLCRFNKRFCKWVPVEIATKNEIITHQQAKQHESRYVSQYRRIK